MTADDDPDLELDDRDHAIIAAVRGLEPTATGPDWAALEAGIQAATTRAPRRHRGYLVGGAIGVAALAAGLALWLARPTGQLALPSLAVAPVVAPAAPVDDAALEPDDDAVALDDDDGDLGAMGAIDDALVEEVIELEAVADDVAGEVDDLPAIGAAWTAWLDDFSDADLDDAERWLDTQEAT